MTPRTSAVENPPEEYSILCTCQYFDGDGGDLRRIRRDLSRHSELDRLCFFVDGFELGKEISPSESRNGLRRLDILQHRSANHYMLLSRL